MTPNEVVAFFSRNLEDLPQTCDVQGVLLIMLRKDEDDIHVSISPPGNRNAEDWVQIPTRRKRSQSGAAPVA